MDAGNEWYWNLNLHRNQPLLNNAMAVNGTKLPISAAMYTSAVLTDRGICVGMRNVNLKGVNHSYSSKMHNIPNCCSNTNIVGQLNNDTWMSAFEQMRFSALTDPSMATQIENQYFEPPPPPPPIDHEWIIPMEFPIADQSQDSDHHSSNSISAELNPFHLFGDKSSLSTFNYKEKQNQILAQAWNHSTDTLGECFHRPKAELLTPPINPSPYVGYHYLSEFDDTFNSAPLHGHPNFIYPRSMSSSSNSTTSHLPCYKLKAMAMAPHRRRGKSASRPNHVVAPKKKWIRNYMQSNSHIWFSFSNCNIVYFRNIFIFNISIRYYTRTLALILLFLKVLVRFSECVGGKLDSEHPHIFVGVGNWKGIKEKKKEERRYSRKIIF